MKITSDIYEIGGPSVSHPSDASIFLIKSDNEAALIDSGTGLGIDSVIENIISTSTKLTDIKFLFLTHCHYDHTGGANEIQELSQCSIVAHELDAEFLEAGDSDVTAASWYGEYIEPTKIDIKVNTSKAEFKIGNLDINFYHTPGHSPGSAVLTVNSDDKLVLFGQDVHGPLNDMLRSNREEYIKSLEFLLTLNADILCEGHFGIYYGKDRVREFIESFL